eukprot:GHRQ01003238.1.p1 GENE.GHRQ01003238.1~~GHRQ01003238.1.p1  ORF type:complete len:189 (+),score=33.77 GHRQ01003238.1:135-701(+)
MEQDSDCCWICLCGQDAGELASVCSCPRRVHEKCLARWQLHSAGRREEKMCRFCGSALQDWKPHMSSGAKVAPYMRVSFNGKTHKVQVQPGEDGAKEFEQQIRRMLTLPDDQEFDVIFHCRAPGTGASSTVQPAAGVPADVPVLAATQQQGVECVQLHIMKPYPFPAGFATGPQAYTHHQAERPAAHC